MQTFLDYSITVLGIGFIACLLALWSFVCFVAGHWFETYKRNHFEKSKQKYVDAYMKASRDELRCIAKEKGLSPYFTKEDLVKRILNG